VSNQQKMNPEWRRALWCAALLMAVVALSATARLGAARAQATAKPVPAEILAASAEKGKSL